MESPLSQRLLIFPHNGNGLEALACLRPNHHLVGFIDDTPDKQGKDRFGHPVLSRRAIEEYADALVLAVPGSSTSYRSRMEIVTGLGVSDNRFARVVHPTAFISPLALIGHNVLIMAGAVITSNATIGNHVCVLPNTVIHHDVVIGAWTLIGSNVTLAGNTIVGNNCYIGSGSTLINGVHIGDGALIGLGSNVIRNVRSGARVAGNPARELIEEPANDN
jgi:sugar O-acyltransferase (sialic acid O-acetyltransferase NeuD family)